MNNKKSKKLFTSMVLSGYNACMLYMAVLRIMKLDDREQNVDTLVKINVSNGSPTT